jgi:pyruvate/2-oxoglutarate dehydrogenase complex dihydrolipoamide acyltransferase (E2) component
MAYELTLPDIGEGLTEAEIVRWLVPVGETVAANQPIVEVETDKAVVEIPSPQGGVLLHVGGAEGDVIAVGDLLAVIGAAGEAWEAQATAPVTPTVATQETTPGGPAPPRPEVRAMPAVRKLARELGIDLTTVAGSGPAGRLLREDVERAAAPAVSAEPSEEDVYAGEALTAMRRTIARNLTRSWKEIPHVTVWRAVEATRVLAARAETGAPLEALLVRAALPVLAEFPDFNAAFDGEALHRSEAAHIGIAVDTAAGLMVPVLRDAGSRSLGELSTEVVRLKDEARSRSLGLGELTGGTFTISNVGAVGGGYGTPIIPLGTTAILSIGRAEDTVVVHDKAIAVAAVFPVALSFDHRVIDGAAGSRFLLRFAAAMEDFTVSGIQTDLR